MSINAEETTSSRNPHSARPGLASDGPHRRPGTQTPPHQVQLALEAYDSGSYNAQHIAD
jgi:hypothetical protein